MSAIGGVDNLIRPRQEGLNPRVHRVFCNELPVAELILDGEEEGGLAVNRCDVWDLWKGHHHFERDVELFRRFGVGRKAVGERIDSELGCRIFALARFRSEEHTSELQSLMRISYAVFCLKKKNKSKMKSPTP